MGFADFLHNLTKTGVYDPSSGQTEYFNPAAAGIALAKLLGHEAEPQQAPLDSQLAPMVPTSSEAMPVPPEGGAAGPPDLRSVQNYGPDPNAPQEQTTFSAPQAPQAHLTHPSFSEATDVTNPNHKALTKGGALINILKGGLMGGLAGQAASAENYARTGRSGGVGVGLGAGFEAPYQMAEQKQAVQRGQLQNEMLKRQTEVLGQQVILPNGTVLPWQIAQKLGPAIIGASSREKVAGQNNQTKSNIAEGANAVALRRQGLKLDADGNQVPIAPEEMSDLERGVLGLKQAQSDAANAKAALDKAKNDPNSPAYQLAYKQLQAALRRTAAIEGNLGLRQAEYNANYFGTDAKGNPLPGAPANPDSPTQAEGLKTANVTKPTTEMRNKASTAQSVIDTGTRLTEQLNDPQIRAQLGAIMRASHWNTLKDLVGQLPPELAGLGANMGSMAAFTAGLHPVRGLGAIQHFDKVFEGPTHARSPEDILASIKEMTDTANKIKARGSVPTVQHFDPSKAERSATGPNGAKIYQVNGKLVDATGKPIQ